MTHYSVLGVSRKSTRDEIVAAYRRRALQCHPDKPGGSVELFNRLKAAYDTLQDAGKRTTYDGELAELRRKKNFRAPPPLSNPRMPETFHLPDGSKYVFETAPDRLKCKFRHGDVVRHTDGEQGIFVGIAGDGLYYWCPINTTHAVPLNTFGGEKDIAILFRQNTNATTRTAAPAGRAPSRSAPRPAASGSFHGSFASASSANAERADRAAASRMDAEIKRRTADAEKLEKQRLRRFQGAVSQIMTEESARRYTLVRAAERHWENFHADCKRAADRISRRYQTSSVSAAVTPARRRTSTTHLAPGQRNEGESASPAGSPPQSASLGSPKEVPARDTRSQRPAARTTTPTPVRAGSKAAGQRAAPTPVASATYRSVRPRIFAHLATPPPAAIPRRSVSPEAEHDPSPGRASSERHGGHTPRSQQARDVPTVDPSAPLSPPAKVKPPQTTVAPLNLNNVRAGDDSDDDDGRSPTDGPLDAPRGKSQPQEHVDPTLQQPPRPAARVPAKSTPRAGIPTRTASKSAAASTIRRTTPAANLRTATPRSTMTPRTAAPAAAPALHSVRINNAFLHRRGTTAPSSAMDEEHREEYDNLVRAAMRRQHTPRRGNTPSSRRTSSAVPSRTAPNTPADPQQASSGESPFERHPKSPEGRPSGAPTGHQPPELLQSVRPRLRRMSDQS